MKKGLLYLFIFILIIFILPIICTRPKKVEKLMADVSQGQDENEGKKESDKVDGKTIKLYHTESKDVEEVPFEEYIYGTVSAEMPANYEMEALKAQAVVSRTYTLYQMKNGKKHDNADICDDYSCCQAWISKSDRLAKWSEEDRENNWNKIVEAVDSTNGKVIKYDGEIINAFFHSNSGGITEIVSNVWGGSDFPYLQSVETSGESEYSQYNSEVILTKEELMEKLKKEYSNFEIDFGNIEAIKILDYTESGRVKTVRFGNTEVAGTKVRSLLGLKSTNFTISIEGDNIRFKVIGYGHGVGMSQTGADSMAKTGSSYEEIIKHFYTGVEVEDK